MEGGEGAAPSPSQILKAVLGVDFDDVIVVGINEGEVAGVWSSVESQPETIGQLEIAKALYISSGFSDDEE